MTASLPPLPPKVTAYPSPNFNDRPVGQQPEMLVFHYTGMETGAAALARMCDPAAEVSAHYMIEEDGHILQLVADDKRAWHAGVAFWRGHENVNNISIGIEIVNRGPDPYPQQQMQAVGDLAAYLVRRYAIRPEMIVGHSDIAPNRKEDPGPQFNWRWLAEQGIGLVARDLAPKTVMDMPQSDNSLWASLFLDLGYDPAYVTGNGDIDPCVIKAFQMHWCQQSVTGQLDLNTRQALVSVHQQVKKADIENDGDKKK